MSDYYNVAATPSPAFDNSSTLSPPLESITEPPSSSPPVFGQELDTYNIVWTRLPGYHLAEKSSRTVYGRIGWTWRWGFDVQHQQTGKKFWLCKICHVRKKQNIF